MTQFGKACALPILFLGLGAPVAWSATAAEVKAAVEAQFTVTTRTMMGSVKAPGTVLVVQQDGIRGTKPSAFMKPSIIRGGKLTSVGGGGVILGGNKGHSLKAGERVLLYGVKAVAESVVLLIATVETFDVVDQGSTVSVPFEAAVGFQYDGGVAGVPLATIVSDIGLWFKTEKDSASANTKTIGLGQTPEQVIAILGAPEKKIELGQKAIYIYKDLKVVFMKGKVSDVE